MDFQINEEKKIVYEFKRLADIILLKKELIVNDKTYRFTEIEFYYYSKNHKDAFTHKHEYEAGKWRFHNQGLDITLKGKSGYGGILIRGIESNNTRFINGPRRVMFEIMKHLNPVNQCNNTIGIKDGKYIKEEIFETIRHELNNPIQKNICDNPSKYKNANYRFIIKPQLFDKKQFSGAEKIARKFNNKDLSFQFLGYNLKKNHDSR
jgi:hypothetical protein